MSASQESGPAEPECDFELRPGEQTPITDTPAARRDANAFREVLGRFVTGLTVVTGVAPDGTPVGLTCQAFTSVSLTPPLVLFCPAQTSRSWPMLRESGSFTVNLLSADHHEIASLMATKGADKFADLRWHPAPVSGGPVLEGALGYLDCEVRAVHPGGDHEIVVGLVRELEAYDDRSGPLVYYRGDYRRLGEA